MKNYVVLIFLILASVRTWADENQINREFREQAEIRAQTAFEQSLMVNLCPFSIALHDLPVAGTLALTFDDGPNVRWTPKVLDVLKKYNVKAQFMILGRNIKGHEAILQRIIAEGHLLANHSFSHANFRAITLEQSKKEILQTETLLAPFARGPLLFRFPYGSSTCAVRDYLTSLNYHVVGWNIDSCDWAFNDGVITDEENISCRAEVDEKQSFEKFVLRRTPVGGGGIILMHDISSMTAIHLENLIKAWQGRNYRFVQLDDRTVFPNLSE